MVNIRYGMYSRSCCEYTLPEKSINETHPIQHNTSIATPFPAFLIASEESDNLPIPHACSFPSAWIATSWSFSRPSGSLPPGERRPGAIIFAPCTFCVSYEPNRRSFLKWLGGRHKGLGLGKKGRRLRRTARRNLIAPRSI